VQTARTIATNKPDIIICDNAKEKKKRNTYVDSCRKFGDRNVIKKEAEKILQHKDLTREIQSTWNVKTKVMPVTIGATGTIPKSLRQ